MFRPCNRTRSAYPGEDSYVAVMVYGRIVSQHKENFEGNNF